MSDGERKPSTLGVVQGVVSNLQSTPMMLSLLVLNAIGISAAVWFLNKMADAQAQRMDIILKACLPK
jgi:hypothetical protein